MTKRKTKHGLRKGQTITVKIDSLAQGGDGVGSFEGVPIFISRVATGDRVEAQLFDVRKDFARGRLVRLIESSNARVEPVCKVFDRCGGCQWQHIEYCEQLLAKEEIVKQSLKRIGGISSEVVEPTAGTSHHLRYRNKAQFPVGTGVTENTIAAGYFERNSHRLVDIDECPVIPERLDLVLNQIKAACGKAGLSPYDEISHTGMLRHISLRQSFFNQEILATLVLNVANLEKLAGRQVERLRSVAEQVREKVPEVVGFCLNFNTLKGNKILSEKTICLSGKPTIEEVLQSHEQERPEALRQGLSFRLSANSFFQVHRQQAVFILDQVFDLVKNRTSASGDAKPLIVDAYAGVGTIAMWLCDLACKVVAVEENPFAVQDGRKNLLLNKIANVEFHQGQAETVLPALYAQGLRPDILILDPPRKGAGSEVLEAVLEMAPELVVYVSCNPATLSRDLKILASGNKAGINWQEQERETQGRFGYKTQRVKPVDLFPQTYHVESIASLERIFFDGTVGNLEEI